MINKKSEKGITLVALVVTIIVLLILAGITITYTMGDNSIFSKAKSAKEEYENAQTKENTMLNKYTNLINNYANENGGELLKINNKHLLFIYNNVLKKLKNESENGELLDDILEELNNCDTIEKLLNNDVIYSKVLSVNESVDYIIQNADVFINEFINNEKSIKSLSKNEYAKSKIKQNEKWITALKKCDYAYESWTQPTLTSETKNEEEGIITATDSTIPLLFPSWKAMDGKLSGDDTGYWFCADSPAYWQIEFPYEIKIKSIEFYNQSSTEPSNRILTARLYTDSSMTTPIGDQFSADSNWQKIIISGITPNQIITNKIYFYKTSGKAGIGELVINADKFLF